MWVRVTCPNGHRVKIETKYLGRNNRCPRCQAHVFLWIQVTCANGHTLRVQSKYAGRQGTCPECKELVTVPDLTEVIAMETLGDSVLGDGTESTQGEAMIAESESSGSAVAGDSSFVAEPTPQAAMRDCPHCKSKIAKELRTCPVCEKYLGDAGAIEAPVSATGRSITCAECGVTSFPGDEYCSSCGSRLE